jgi:hypothetical protein
MIELLPERPAEIVRFRGDSWPHQQTFETPLRDLRRFVSRIFEPFALESAVVTTDEVVFEPEHMLEHLAKASIRVENLWHFSIRSEGRADSEELLACLLSDWIDFLFVPKPESVAIYADHDEFTTIYGPREEVVREIAASLEAAGFKAVRNYVRGVSEGKWR